MNKTQYNLISRLVNRFDKGSLKQGWTLTDPKTGNPFLSLQKLNEGNQAHHLKDKYPEIFETKQISFRLVILELKDDLKAREILKKFESIA